MENASRALFIAAGVILALMVLSIGVYLFVTFGQAAEHTHKEVQEEQLNQFNSQFTSYLDRTDLTIYDVITVANLATQNNVYNELDKTNNREKKESYYIAVTLNDRKITGDTKEMELGKGSGASDIERENQNIIKAHVQEITSGGYFKKDAEGNLERTMPKIKCNQVDISNITRKSIQLNV